MNFPGCKPGFKFYKNDCVEKPAVGELIGTSICKDDLW